MRRPARLHAAHRAAPHGLDADHGVFFPDAAAVRAGAQVLARSGTIDRDRRELFRGSEAIATAPQVFDLLLYMLENREHVVSRDSLIEVVWSGQLVSESTLASRINAVRKAIGDAVGRSALSVLSRARASASSARSRTSRTSPASGMPGKQRPAALLAVRGPASPRPPHRPKPLHRPFPRPSIAILPFVNLRGDPEQDYFVDGVVEDVITALSRIRWLFVIARNSSFTYKGRAVDVKQVGRELGVRYVLEGSLRKAMERVRITG
jgi:hypothetical protein